MTETTQQMILRRAEQIRQELAKLRPDYKFVVEAITNERSRVISISVMEGPVAFYSATDSWPITVNTHRIHSLFTDAQQKVLYDIIDLSNLHNGGLMASNKHTLWLSLGGVNKPYIQTK